MITLDFTDRHLKENLEAIKTLKEFGYTDEQLQKWYDEQVKADHEREGANDEQV